MKYSLQLCMNCHAFVLSPVKSGGALIFISLSFPGAGAGGAGPAPPPLPPPLVMNCKGASDGKKWRGGSG